MNIHFHNSLNWAQFLLMSMLTLRVRILMTY